MRQDMIALAAGLGFIVFILGMMWLWGELQGWDADSGYSHNYTNTSQDRFLSEPFGCKDETVPGRSGSECTGWWYYWKLPPDQANAMTRAIVWLFYSLHQIFIWGLIYRAQLTVTRNKYEKEDRKYSNDLRWFNWSMLIVNALFHVLHLVQTHWTYDATAQDVSISSSQSSVIMMICFIAMMEYKERGFIFYWPNPKSSGKVADTLRLHPGPITLIRKYHGFAFAWACIYTFWYHPMENTWGHTLGFFHTAIVLLQGSLAFTEIHKNRYWRLLNECWVLIHATVVALQTGNPEVEGRSDLWPIFFFGFGFLFAFTQIFGLPFWRKAPAWTRIFPPLLFLGVVSALCATVVAPTEEGKSGFSRMYMMTFIPVQVYLQIVASWFCIFVFLLIEAKFHVPPQDQEEVDGHNKGQNQFVMPSPTKQALYLCGVILIYVSFILGSYFYQQAYYEWSLTNAMIAFSFMFSVGVCVTVMFFKQLIGPASPLYVSKSSKVDNNFDGTEHDNDAYTEDKM